MLEAFQKEIELMSKNGIYYCVSCEGLRFFDFGKCGVCKNDFRKYVSVDGLSASGLSIINCRVIDESKNGFNPELIICRGLKDSRAFRPCKKVRDCFQFYCVDYDEYKLSDE